MLNTDRQKLKAYIFIIIIVLSVEFMYFVQKFLHF